MESLTQKASAEAIFNFSEDIVVDIAYRFKAKPVLFSAAFYSACWQLKLVKFTVAYTGYLECLERLGILTSARNSYSDSQKYRYHLLGQYVKTERRKFSTKTLEKLTTLKDEIVEYLSQIIKAVH